MAALFWKEEKLRKVAIVTGGARGIGRQISIDLANLGYRVVINYNNSKLAAEKLKIELEEKNCEVEIFKADVSKEEEVISLIGFCMEKYGNIDVLVNNAGISLEGLITDISVDEWDKLIDTNLKSVFLCSRETVKIMLSNHSGKIINITSMWGVTGGSCEVVYSASKAGIIGFTKALAKEVGPSHINVNAIAPGVIMTEMMDGFTNEEVSDLMYNTPLMRLGSVKDVSGIVKFLVSDDSDFVTGQVIGVNGGFVI